MKLRNISITAIYALFAFLSSGLYAQDKGIQFFEGTWKEALAKAKAENKMVFLDAYASWCGPCKKMAKDIFPLSEVGEFYNKNFVNVKMDMEKGEGPELAKAFEVNMYPTYVFLDADGSLSHRSLGQMPAQDFIASGLVATNKEGYYTLKKLYESGNRDIKTLYNYALRIDDAGGTIAALDEVSNAFLAGYSPSEYNQTLIRDFVMKVAYGRDSRAGKLLAEDKEGFVKQFGEEVMSKKIYQLASESVATAIDKKSADIFESTMKFFDQNSTGPLAKELGYRLKVQYYEGTQQWNDYILAADGFLSNQVKPNWQNYNQCAWTIYENCEDQPAIKKAIGWIEMSIGLESNYYNMDSYAALLMKSGDYTRALNIADKAIAIAKESGMDPKETILLKEKITALKK